jgi:hypothetical protein
MKIRKNGKVITLTESELKRIVKRTLNENVDPEEIVIACITENTTLDDLSSLPEACVQMVIKKDVTKALECGMAIDQDTAMLIVKKIDPISKCVANKMKGGNTPVMN